jgi:integral membrane sensor domain MASE1
LSGRLFRDYGLSLVLLGLFLVAWIGQFVAQWVEFANEAHQQGESFQFWDFMPVFWAATLENWQSEFLQLLTFVVLTAYLIHKGSNESKDSQDEMKKQLDRMERRLQQLGKERATQAVGR